MTQFLISVAAFAVAIGVLVSVHEYGHYSVARGLGVRVLRYSIGLGPKVFGWTSRRSNIEYRLSALPLGGYVKMLDEREGPVPEADKAYAFNRVHPWRRILIVAAGPGVNILFAVFAYWLVFMLGVPGIKPIIAAPTPHSPAAAAGLHAKDRIIDLAGHSIDDWQALRFTLMERALDNKPVSGQFVSPNGDRHSFSLDLRGAPADPTKLFKMVGLAPFQPPTTPKIVKVIQRSPAADAGLHNGDEVLAVDGRAVVSPQALVAAIHKHPDARVTLRVRRRGQTRAVEVALGRTSVDGHSVGRLGAEIGVPTAAWKAMESKVQLGPAAAIPAAVARAWNLSVLSVRLIGRMIVGQISWHNVGGPIQIATVAGQSAQIGLVAFLSFLAFVSINLALINLLPIPVLDGGHLLYYAIEWIRGRPLSEAVQAVGQQVGIAALLLLMAVAFYNDILRLLG